MSKDFKIPKLLPVGSSLICACSSGAKKLRIVGYKHMQGTDKRRLTGGIGSLARVVVTQGKNTLKKVVHNALIIRQKYPITRFKGEYAGKIRFEDNAAVLLDNDARVKKATIKGPIAKEVLAFKKHYDSLNGVFR